MPLSRVVSPAPSVCVISKRATHCAQCHAMRATCTTPLALTNGFKEEECALIVKVISCSENYISGVNQYKIEQFSKIALSTMRNLGIPANPDLNSDEMETKVIADDLERKETNTSFFRAHHPLGEGC